MSDDLFAAEHRAVPCPKCGHETEKSIGWLKANHALTCAGCGDVIAYDPAQLEAAIGNVAKRREDLVRQIRKGISIKFRL